MSKANDPVDSAGDRGKVPPPWQRGDATSSTPNTGMTAGEMARAAAAEGDALMSPSDSATQAVPAQPAPGPGDGPGGTPGPPPASRAGGSQPLAAKAAPHPTKAAPKPAKAVSDKAVPPPQKPASGSPASGSGGAPTAAGTAAPAKAAPAKTAPAKAAPPAAPPAKNAAPGPAKPGAAPQGSAPTAGAAAPGSAGAPTAAVPATGVRAPAAAGARPPVGASPASGAHPDLDAIHKVGATAEGPERASVRRIPATGTIGTPLRAAVQVRRIDPWSVFKVTGVLTVAGFLIWMIAIAVLYGVLAGMGIWDQVNSSFATIVSADGTSDGGNLISAGQVFGFSALFGVFAAVVLTALATIMAYIYNVCADVVGGFEVTLADLD